MTHVVLPRKRVTGETVADRLTENVRERVLPARYLRRDASGDVVETPAELFRRVATAVATVEADHGNDPDEWAERFEAALTRLEFVPNSPTLMNAGTRLGQLSACFVLNPDDDLGDVFRTVRRAAEIFQTGGGVGYSFSALRPRGDVVGGTGGVASGPVSFMRVFDTMCEVLKQGGRRRGAQMGVLRVDHPDVGRFCVAKRREGRLANFNVSVGVTERFLDAVAADGEYALANPRTGDQYEATASAARFYNAAYADASERAVRENLWRDYADEVEGLDAYRGDLVTVGEPATLPARFVWLLVADGAWRNGEPGVFFLDRANARHTFDHREHPGRRVRATNPCGEQPLEEFESCTLGHVNLSLLAREDAPDWRDFDAAGALDDRIAAFLDAAVDGERLDRTVDLGVRFLDDVASASDYPLRQISAQVADLRKVGLGVMGFGELLVQLGVSYGSDASVELAGQLMERIDHRAKRASHALAAERGSFPAWADSKYADPTRYPEWFRARTGEDPADWADGYPIRNHGVTSVAPTGTTSMIADTSPGCEPLYDVVYFRNVGRDVQGAEPLVEFDDYFLRALEANRVDADAVKAEAVERLRAGTFAGPASLDVPAGIAELFVRASDVAPADHVRVQAAFQAHVDGAVSKTVNVPHEAARDAVAEVFDLATELGCVGVTVYRSGSRSGQVLATTPAETGARGGE